MLYVRFSDAPSVESEEVIDGFVFDYGRDGKVVGIEVEHASHRVDVSTVRLGGAFLVKDAPASSAIYTVSVLSRELGVSPRALQKSIRAMAEAGIQVGRQVGNATATILTDEDVNRIKQWRQQHKPGRPSRAPR